MNNMKMYSFETNRKLKVSKTEIEEIMLHGLAFARETWATATELKENVEVDMPLDEALTNGFSVKILEGKVSEWHHLTLDRFLKGVALMERHNYDKYTRRDCNRVIQYAIFGSERYS
jgi:hypothetical protein